LPGLPVNQKRKLARGGRNRPAENIRSNGAGEGGRRSRITVWKKADYYQKVLQEVAGGEKRRAEAGERRAEAAEDGGKLLRGLNDRICGGGYKRDRMGGLRKGFLLKNMWRPYLFREQNAGQL